MVAASRHRLLVLCLGGMLLAAGGGAHGDETAKVVLSEYQIKAAYLYYFTTFVDWPSETYSRTAETVVVGVLGEDPFGAILDETFRGKSVNSRRLVVKRFANYLEAQRKKPFGLKGYTKSVTTARTFTGYWRRSTRGKFLQENVVLFLIDYEHSLESQAMLDNLAQMKQFLQGWYVEFTGKPFEYRAEGTVAHLRGGAPKGEERNPAFGPRYEVTVRK